MITLAIALETQWCFLCYSSTITHFTSPFPDHCLPTENFTFVPVCSSNTRRHAPGRNISAKLSLSDRICRPCSPTQDGSSDIVLLLSVFNIYDITVVERSLSRRFFTKGTLERRQLRAVWTRSHLSLPSDPRRPRLCSTSLSPLFSHL